jgi:hypothetical protein
VVPAKLLILKSAVKQEKDFLRIKNERRILSFADNAILFT